MGLLKKIKKVTGSVSKAVGDLTGTKLLGKATSIAIGGPVGLSGYSMVEREQKQAQNAIATAENLQNIEAQKNAQIAEEQRQKTLLQEDIQKLIEEERKRTTFAGSSMQGITERKRLLGV